ncbi:MAG: glycosyltransferase family 4 protein [Sulfuricurvum sp.]|nr:glycosyltransferase family 4 protein [Sulfuricurvum sp.]
MKILITTEQYFPILSGVSTVVTSVAEELIKNGHTVTVATSCKNRNYSSHNGVTIKEFKIEGGFGRYYKGEKKAYVSYVLSSDVDVIINECVQTWNSDLLFPHLSKIKAIKILHSHGFPLFQSKSRNPWANLKAKFYYRSLIHYLNNYDMVLILSSLASEIPYFQKYHFGNYEILPNGVPHQIIASEPKRLPENPFLLSISNFFPMKNQELILKAFYLSSNKAALIFIGSSQLHGYLNTLKSLKQSLDAKYGEREVFFYDTLSREETINYLTHASLFLHGSKLEAFPIVILEAMATGTPWICTEVGNVKELAGGLVLKNEHDMALSIDALLNDSTYYSQLSADGLESTKHYYNWQSITKSLESTILKIQNSKLL